MTRGAVYACGYEDETLSPLISAVTNRAFIYFSMTLAKSQGLPDLSSSFTSRPSFNWSLAPTIVCMTRFSRF
jgi:hypothetical protein